MQPILGDGSVMQAGLIELLNTDTSERIDYLCSGVVVDVLPPDDDRNLSGNAVEYEVILQNRRRVRARCVWSSAGVANGFDMTLRAAKKTISGSPLDLDLTPLDDMDGDHVALDALYGHTSQFVITAKLPHPQTELSPTSDQLPRIKLTWEGTEITLDKEGHFLMERAEDDLEMSFGADKKVYLKAGGTTLTLDDSKAAITAALVEAKDSGTSQVLSKGIVADTLLYFLSYLDSIAVGPLAVLKLATTPCILALGGTPGVISPLPPPLVPPETTKTSVLKGE